ncbi:MAG: NADH-quinone oxidoreductase subunit L [Myxococcales bacterium]|nr:NADH-quinone oxidoreductase subunit L [Myxococcales bacterium]
MESLLGIIVFLPLLGAVINGLAGKKLGKGVVTFVGCATVGVAFVAALFAWLHLKSGQQPFHWLAWNWIDAGSLHVNLEYYFDHLSALMTLVVTGVGFLIHVFSVGYMGEDKSYYRYFAYLNLFMFSMLNLVLGSNMVVMFLGWEGVGLCSYLLIGFWFDDDLKAQAGQKAFIVNRIGDFGFLIGMFLLLFYADGTVDYLQLQSLFSDQAREVGTLPLRDSLTITAICLCLFVGACGKSAQIPLYVWLPDAMAGPTPVSALIHAATMVTAGVYMITRLNFLFMLSPIAMATIATVGALTAIFAATIGIVQRDIKKVLAYSTVSQLGYMFLGVGVGAFGASVFHLMTHAFFKALLFLGSGAVIHAMHGEQDIFKMGNLRKLLPITHITFLIGTIAIAGVPGFAGFFSKEAILHGSAGLGLTTDVALTGPWGLSEYAGVFAGWFQVLTVVGLVAALCTAFYMFRLYFVTFWTDYRGDRHSWDHPHKPGFAMEIPLMVLAVLSIVGGYFPVSDWLAPILSRPAQLLVENHDSALSHMLMPISITVACIGIVAAWFLYVGPGRRLPSLFASRLSWLHTVVFNKYFVDELYHGMIVRPVQVVAQALFLVVDRVVIDGIGVRGAPWVVAMTGRMIRFVQNGEVQRYAVAMVVGLAVLVYFLK